jgi:putative transcriptional regulator
MKMTLKAARVNANLTQLEAAKRLDISESTLFMWEKGKTFPDARKILEIEQAYGIPFDEIIFLPKHKEQK